MFAGDDFAFAEEQGGAETLMTEDGLRALAVALEAEEEEEERKRRMREMIETKNKLSKERAAAQLPRRQSHHLPPERVHLYSLSAAPRWARGPPAARSAPGSPPHLRRVHPPPPWLRLRRAPRCWQKPRES